MFTLVNPGKRNKFINYVGSWIFLATTYLPLLLSLSFSRSPFYLFRIYCLTSITPPSPSPYIVPWIFIFAFNSNAACALRKLLILELSFSHTSIGLNYHLVAIFSLYLSVLLSEKDYREDVFLRRKFLLSHPGARFTRLVYKSQDQVMK